MLIVLQRYRREGLLDYHSVFLVVVGLANSVKEEKGRRTYSESAHPIENFFLWFRRAGVGTVVF